MIVTCHIKYLEERCFQRGYSLSDVSGCIVSRSGDILEVDTGHVDYPREGVGTLSFTCVPDCTYPDFLCGSGFCCVDNPDGTNSCVSCAPTPTPTPTPISKRIIDTFTQGVSGGFSTGATEEYRGFGLVDFAPSGGVFQVATLEGYRAQNGGASNTSFPIRTGSSIKVSSGSAQFAQLTSSGSAQFAQLTSNAVFSTSFNGGGGSLSASISKSEVVGTSSENLRMTLYLYYYMNEVIAKDWTEGGRSTLRIAKSPGSYVDPSNILKIGIRVGDLVGGSASGESHVEVPLSSWFSSNELVIPYSAFSGTASFNNIFYMDIYFDFSWPSASSAEKNALSSVSVLLNEIYLA